MDNEPNTINYELVYCDCGKKYRVPNNLSNENKFTLKCKECGKRLFKNTIIDQSFHKKIEVFKCAVLSVNALILIAILAELTIFIIKPIKIHEPISVEGFNNSNIFSSPTKPIKIEGTVTVDKINHDVKIRKSLLDYP